MGRMALASTWHAKLRFALLTVLIAIGVLVFLAVAELSRASSESLHDAIDSDLGATGTYRIDPAPQLGLTRRELIDKVGQALSSLTAGPISVIDALPPVRPECPPFDTLGDLATFVIRDEHGDPKALDATSSPTQADLCLAGLTVPRAALRGTTDDEARTFGAGLVLAPEYEHLVSLTSTAPTRTLVIVTSGRDEDLRDQILSDVRSELAGDANRAGIPTDSAVTVTRVDSGSQVRSASDGIALVYLLIGWGVLLVGGLGILVAELIVLRDRMWFLGLARAVGARRTDIAMLVLSDIALVLIAGFAAAAVVALGTQPIVESFGQRSFGTSLVLLRWDVTPRLVGGAALMLTLGGAYPAWRATRLDPWEVLERR
jgi:hypothetical protein